MIEDICFIASSKSFKSSFYSFTTTLLILLFFNHFMYYFYYIPHKPETKSFSSPFSVESQCFRHKIQNYPVDTTKSLIFHLKSNSFVPLSALMLFFFLSHILPTYGGPNSNQKVQKASKKFARELRKRKALKNGKICVSLRQKQISQQSTKTWWTHQMGVFVPPRFNKKFTYIFFLWH